MAACEDAAMVDGFQAGGGGRCCDCPHRMQTLIKSIEA
jgi:hypothetical protein